MRKLRRAIARKMEQVKPVVGRVMQVAGAAGTVAVTTVAAHAQTTPDPTTIVSSSSTLFTAVATLCVTIGTFMIGYRLARKVR